MVSIQTPLPPSLNHVINAREPLPPKKREHYKTLWQTYGWNQTLDFDQMMENHPDFFHFLRDSKTLYTIRGYQHSFQKAETPLQEAEPFKQAINADMNGHPLLYKEGNWVRWEEIKQEIEYSPKRKQLVSQDNDMVEWNYLYPFGLIPQSN